MKAIAVLLPVYGGDNAQWFQESIESIISQRSIPGYEVRIYLGIDGPLDNAVTDVIDIFKSRIYHIERANKRSGLAANLNRLLMALSDEEIIVRVDSDDRCLQLRFYTQIKYLIDHPNIDILGSFMYYIDEYGVRFSDVVRYPIKNSDIRRYFPLGNPIAHPTVAIRRRVFDTIGKYDVKKFPEDLNLWYRAASKNLILFNLPFPLVEFRFPKNISKKRGRHWAISELTVNYFGMRKLGCSSMIVFSLMRFAIRLFPSKIIEIFYCYRKDMKLNSMRER
jgi:hypothetical protein